VKSPPHGNDSALAAERPRPISRMTEGSLVDNDELISHNAPWWERRPVLSDAHVYNWQMMRIVEEECAATIGIFRESLKKLGYQAGGTGPLNNPEWPTALWWLRDRRVIDPRLPIEKETSMLVQLLISAAMEGYTVLGGAHPSAKSFLGKFRAAARIAFNHPLWLSASMAWEEKRAFDSDLIASRIWIPSVRELAVPTAQRRTSKSLLLLAQVLVQKREELTALSPYEFENLIGVLLERGGWTVEVTRQTKDGGIDVISTAEFPPIGHVRAVWQAKRYSRGRKVSLSDVRELAWVAAVSGASKGILVTTTSLTRDAVSFIEQRRYRLGAVTGEELRNWILRSTHLE
jgi:Restriction endonuclease